MVTSKKSAGKTTGKLKLKKTTIKNLDAKKTVKGGVATGAACQRRGTGAGTGTVPQPVTIVGVTVACIQFG